MILKFRKFVKQKNCKTNLLNKRSIKFEEANKFKINCFCLNLSGSKGVLNQILQKV